MALEMAMTAIVRNALGVDVAHLALFALPGRFTCRYLEQPRLTLDYETLTADKRARTSKP